jgi:ABC-type multidrug transport system fused ATPase/permease subunit
MAFEELKMDLKEADADLRSYLEHSEEHLKLKVFKVFMISITTAAQALLIGAIALLALLLLSLAASYALGELWDNIYLGFLAVGLFYTVLAIGCYLLREKLDSSIIRRFSKYYFDAL